LGGIHKVAKKRFTKNFKAYSELIPHGEVKWKNIEVKDGASVEIAPHMNNEVDWGDLVRSLGSMGITEWQGWAVGTLALSGPRDVDVQCLGVPNVVIGNVTMVGDVYNRQQYWSTIKLDRGIHRALIRLRAKVSQVFQCNFRINSAPMKVHNPHFMPDIYDRHFIPQPIALPVTSYTRRTIAKVAVLEPASLLEAFLLDGPVQVAKGQTIPLKIQLTPLKPKFKLVSSCVDLPVVLSIEDHKIDLKLRCREKGSSFLFTFVDHDGSVQHAAAIEPRLCRESCPVVLSLHGTTVPPQNQADSYKRMENGQFVFGVDEAWLLAPTR
jgi:hypothetical protein